MKHLSAFGFFTMLLLQLMAQPINTSASIGAGYTDQTWYQLQSGNSTSAAKADWDIAFELSGQGSSILFNTIAGAQLWAYPHSDTSGWATLDTAGIGGWEARWNSDSSWAEGAFSKYLNPLDPFDLGWGVYSTLTHYVTGDSLYIVKLANGNYKKLWIRQLGAGTYTFTHADLNGANVQDRSIVKANYAGKNFVYYALANDAVIDREPLSADWDLFFTQYTTFIPTAYTVSGVIVNKNYQVAKVENVADVANYVNWAGATFQTPINGIGYDWKAFTGSWVIEDSLLYFLRKPNGEIWKLVFTGFEGSATGNFLFSKELIAATGLSDGMETGVNTLAVYPNPSNGEHVSVAYELTQAFRLAQITVKDLSGKTLVQTSVSASVGSHVESLSLGLANGLYLLDLELDGQHHLRRLVIQ